MLTSSVLVELGLEVDAASGVSVVGELDPLFSGALFGEEAQGDLSLTDVVALVDVGVVDVNLNVVADETGVDLHELVVPLGILAAIVGDGGGPLFVADLDVDDWVHLVEETTLVVFEVSGLEVEMDVAMAGVGKNDYDWH